MSDPTARTVALRAAAGMPAAPAPLTEAQAQVQAAARHFLAELDRLIPGNTAHWAVEDARSAVGVLARIVVRSAVDSRQVGAPALPEVLTRLQQVEELVDSGTPIDISRWTGERDALAWVVGWSDAEDLPELQDPEPACGRCGDQGSVLNPCPRCGEGDPRL